MTTTDIGHLLLAGILAEPADNAARLVYADWLEENGRPEYAEFIRVQVELAREPHCVNCGGKGYMGYGSFTAACRWCRPARLALRRRERELLDACGYGWCDGLFGDGWKVDGQAKGQDTVAVRYFRGQESVEVVLQFARGFVGSVIVPTLAALAGPCGAWHCSRDTYDPSCRSCGGSGLAPTAAAVGLWGRQPVETVLCQEFAPQNYHNNGGPHVHGWWDERRASPYAIRPRRPCDIPGWLWDLVVRLPGGIICGGWVDFDSAPAAHAALSAAVVAMLRKAVGLPALA